MAHIAGSGILITFAAMFCEKIRKSYLLRVLLLVLFVSYYCGTTSFWHVHTDGTQRTVHSHPYTSGSASHPGHTHTSLGYQLLNQLANPQILLATVLSFSAAVFLLTGVILGSYIRPAIAVYYRHRPLRAPPAIG